ncbi:19711_t:CDS:1, partial [Racocetra fulgida]
FGILFSDQSQKSYQKDIKEDDKKNNEYEYARWFAKHRRVA